MKTIRKINHRGFEITINQTAATRFGTLYFATNNYGEPMINQLYFQTVDEAIADGEKNLDFCLED